MTMLRSTYGDPPADPQDAMEDDVPMSAEAWMDTEFGPGTWVRDSWADLFITYDPNHRGPGIGYLLVDRQRRRSTKVVHRHQIH